MSFLGQTISERYHVTDVIGRGGFASIYSAQDATLDRDVAIKFLNPETALANDVDRFQNEARMLAKVRHPNVVQVFDFGVHEDEPFLVMERLEGETLAGMIERGEHDPSRIQPLLLGALDGLAVAHKLGLVHKDLKPQNLFVARDLAGERLVVLDYGLGRRLGNERHRYTQTGKIAGSPNYLPPEYIEGADVCPQNDVYQMALIIAEAFTGSKVVAHKGMWEAIEAHLNGDLTIGEEFQSHDWYPVVVQALSLEPKDRFRDAGEFADALRESTSEVIEVEIIDVSSESMLAPPPLETSRLEFEVTEHACVVVNRGRVLTLKMIFALTAVVALVAVFLFPGWVLALGAALISLVAIGAILVIDDDVKRLRVSSWGVEIERKKKKLHPMEKAKLFLVSGGRISLKSGWSTIHLFDNLAPKDALEVGHFLNAKLSQFREASESDDA